MFQVVLSQILQELQVLFVLFVMCHKVSSQFVYKSLESARFDYTDRFRRRGYNQVACMSDHVIRLGCVGAWCESGLPIGDI